MPFLSHALKVNPEGLALDNGAGSLSYRELQSRAEEVARRLVGAGVAPGDVVALKGEPDVDFVTALHGVWMAGGAVAPLGIRWTPPEEERALELLRPRLTAGPASLADLEPRADPLPGVKERDVAAYLLTSGTTGRPGLVGLTFGNLLANAHASRERLRLGPSDRWLSSLSPAHVGGLALLTRASVLGSMVVLRGAFRADTFLTLAEEGAITHASLVPTMLHQVLDVLGGRKAPRSLRCVLLGGAPAPDPLLGRALAAGLPLALTYGLTEASSQVATAPPRLVRRRPGTVGRPLPGVEVRLEEDGSLRVRGPTVAPGLAGGDGWFRTGDLARLDEEGHLWIVGRGSDRIISGGENVDPAEVEAVLVGHPGVKEAAVVGLPDPVWGERVGAAVVCLPGWGSLEEELHELASRTLSAAKRPRTFRFLDALPRNANGKVDRKGVRSRFP